MPSANQQAETSDETKQAPGSQPALVPIEEWKKWVDMASAAINLFLKVAIALGGCVFFAYSATERFFIDISSLAAVGILVVALMSFVGICMAWIFVFGLSLLWLIILLFKWLNRGNRQCKIRLRADFDRWYLVGVSVFIFIIIFY